MDPPDEAPPVRSAPAGGGGESQAGERLRVVSWNVRSLRDDTGAVAEVLRLLAPDVLLLQEAPRFLLWRRRLATLARRSGLVHVCGGRTTGGPALLVGRRTGVVRAYEWRLPRTPGQYLRGVAAGDVRVGRATLLVASTHLGLTAAERTAHAGELIHLLRRSGETNRVVGADLNESPAGAVWHRLADSGLHDAWPMAPSGGELTFPAAAPRRRIDAVLVSDGTTVTACGTPTHVDAALLAAATDHRPVVADLVVPGH